MRIIDADALKETIVTNVYPVTDYFNSRDYGMFWTGGIEKAIDEQPTIEPKRKKGEWMKTDYYYKLATCSQCNKITMFESWGDKMKIYGFCPNCGADMRGGRADG